MEDMQQTGRTGGAATEIISVSARHQVAALMGIGRGSEAADSTQTERTGEVEGD